MLSNGADTVDIVGSADQHLRPGYVHDHDLGDHTHVSLQNVEIIRLDDQTEYHLLQGGSGTLNDFYYYDTNQTADIAGLGDDRSHIVYYDGGHEGKAFTKITVLNKSLYGLMPEHQSMVQATDLKLLFNQDDISGDWVIQNEKIDVFQQSGIANIDASLLDGVHSMASKSGVDVTDANFPISSDGQIYMVGDNGDIQKAIVNSIDGNTSDMSAGSDFRADFYTQWVVTDD